MLVRRLNKAPFPAESPTIGRDCWKRLTFCEFLAADSYSTQGSNAIESAFATVWLRQRVSNGADCRAEGLPLIFKPLRVAVKPWRRIDSLHKVVSMLEVAKFVDDEAVERDTQERRASVA